MYGYANGNPINFSDPFGLCTPSPECLLQAAANWGARRGGIFGRAVLNVAAAANGVAEASGFNAMGRAIDDADAVAAIGAAAGFAPIGKLGRAGRALRDIDGGAASADEILSGATKWLGDGYSEIAPGVFRSADNTRQFRMVNSNLRGRNPHVNFETIAEDGRTILENSHVTVKP